MDLKTYFENTKGMGVMAAADAEGQVAIALYSRPHVMDDGTLAFIMADRLIHHHLKSNPRAAFLFKEEGPGYQGKRFLLTKVREEENSPLLESLRRRVYLSERDGAKESKFLVFFRVEKELPLVGSED
jgi:hypothetical protein